MSSQEKIKVAAEGTVENPVQEDTAEGCNCLNLDSEYQKVITESQIIQNIQSILNCINDVQGLKTILGMQNFESEKAVLVKKLFRKIHDLLDN